MTQTQSPAGYSGTPLPRKLGIKEGSVVALLGAPRGFRKTLGALPAGAKLLAGANQDCTLTLWFTRSHADLTRGMHQAATLAAHGTVWILWPKLTSSVATDLKEGVVREAGLATGLA